MKINKGIQGHIWVTLFLLLPFLLYYFIDPIVIKERADAIFWAYIIVHFLLAVVFYCDETYNEY